MDIQKEIEKRFDFNTETKRYNIASWNLEPGELIPAIKPGTIITRPSEDYCLFLDLTDDLNYFVVGIFSLYHHKSIDFKKAPVKDYLERLVSVKDDVDMYMLVHEIFDYVMFE